jgi:hypothetical protein
MSGSATQSEVAKMEFGICVLGLASSLIPKMNGRAALGRFWSNL